MRTLQTYLSAPYSRKEEMKIFAEKAKLCGANVVASWIDESHAPNVKMCEVNEELLVEYAFRDLTEAQTAELVVFFSEEPTTPMVRGGRHVEFGVCLNSACIIFVIGPKENIFHYLPKVRHFETEEECLQALEEVCHL